MLADDAFMKGAGLRYKGIEKGRGVGGITGI
jgi:hypothetical protein